MASFEELQCYLQHPGPNTSARAEATHLVDVEKPGHETLTFPMCRGHKQAACFRRITSLESQGDPERLAQVRAHIEDPSTKIKAHEILDRPPPVKDPTIGLTPPHREPTEPTIGLNPPGYDGGR